MVFFILLGPPLLSVGVTWGMLFGSGHGLLNMFDWFAYLYSCCAVVATLFLLWNGSKKVALWVYFSAGFVCLSDAIYTLGWDRFVP